MQNYGTALVTGSTGFIGKQFIVDLAKAYPQLDVYVGQRHTFEVVPDAENKQKSLYLDLYKPIKIERSIDIIFHIAGEKQNECQMWEVNLEGTRRLLDWSASHGVKRFVYLSSVGVYGSRKNAGLVKAESLKQPKNTYESSKSAAEDLVRKKCGEYGIDFVILQPSNVIGWLDGKVFPLLGLMRIIKRGWLTYFGLAEAFVNYVAVEDVASSLVAATKPRAANRVFIINTPVPLKQFVGWIAQELGVPHPDRCMPSIVGSAAAYLADWLGRVFGRSIPFGRDRYNELTNTTQYDGSLMGDIGDGAYSVGIEFAIRQLTRRYMNERLL